MQNWHALFIFSLLFALTLPSCAPYQSDGRKFLQREGLDFRSNSTSSSLQWSFAAYQIEEPCAELVEAPQLNQKLWTQLDPNEVLSSYSHIELYRSQPENTFEILAYQKDKSRHFICAFQYKNESSLEASFAADLEEAQSLILPQFLSKEPRP